MKILLTGGAGFVGSSLAEALIAGKHDLLILDNLRADSNYESKLRNLESLREKGEFSFSQTDIRDGESLKRIFRDFEPERVIHLAAMTGVRHSLKNQGVYCDVNVTGTANLLNESARFRVEQFLFASSSSVYGDSTRLPFRERDRCGKLISPYAVTKQAGEDLCALFSSHEGIPTVCLRFFTIYGPRQRREMAIHKFIRRIEAGETIPVFHRGRSARDYTYIEDAVQAILSSLECRKNFEIYNIGNSNPINLLNLISEIEYATGKKAKINLLPKQPGDVPTTCADISKARSELNFSPSFSIRDGLARFVEWYRSMSS